MFINILKYFYKYKIFKRLVPSIIRIIGGTRKVNLYNFKLLLLLTNSIEREIFLSNYYDKDRFEYLDPLVKKHKFEFFFDIGAYIGYYSLYYSQNLVIRNIFSFEANKTNFDKINKNISINNSNIKSYNIALSNRKGVGKIWFYDKNKTGGSSVYVSSDDEISKYDFSKISYETVYLDTLDSMFSHLKNKKILIKIDVERHELNVLEGSLNLLKNNKILMQIEVLSSQKKIVFDMLIKNNYHHLFSIDDDYFFTNFIKV